MPSGFGSAYLSTKAALVSYSEAVRQEVHRFGVRVCVIEPGFFATNLLVNAARSGQEEAEASAAAARSTTGEEDAAAAPATRRCIFAVRNGAAPAASGGQFLKRDVARSR